MVAASLALVPLAGMTWVYAVGARRARAWFGGQRRRAAACGRAGPGARSSAEMRVFHHSITYLTLLFVAVAVDPFLPV